MDIFKIVTCKDYSIVVHVPSGYIKIPQDLEESFNEIFDEDQLSDFSRNLRISSNNIYTHWIFQNFQFTDQFKCNRYNGIFCQPVLFALFQSYADPTKYPLVVQMINNYFASAALEGDYYNRLFTFHEDVEFTQSLPDSLCEY